MAREDSETDSCRSRCWQCCTEWFSLRIIHCKAPLWFFVVLCYLLFGGLVFSLAERPNELDMIVSAQQRRMEAMEFLVDTFVNLSNGSLNDTQAENLVTNLTDFFAALEELPAESNPLWEYITAVFFSITVITTIGYGNIAPTTATGRTLFVFYALIGIPIAFIFLSILGQNLSKMLTWFLSPIQRRYDTVWVRIITVVASLIIGTSIFITFPAAIFMIVESWSYGDSIYYCFVTLTTVGFGDLVIGDACSTDFRGLYRIGTGVWIWFGLAFVYLMIIEIQKIYGQLCTTQNCNQLASNCLALRERSKKESTPLLQEEEERE